MKSFPAIARLFSLAKHWKPLEQASQLHPAILLGVAGLIFVGLSAIAMSGDSIINDEIAHLPAGYTYLERHDFRLNPEHPPLAKIIAGIPWLFGEVRWPTEEKAWKSGLEWDFGYRLFFQSENDPDVLLFIGRIPMLIWGVMLLATVYALTRELFGVKGAILSLILTTFSPELLAHSHYVTTDVPVALFLLLTVATCSRFVKRPTIPWSLALGLMLGGTLTVKFSSLMLMPALVIVIVAGFILHFRRTDPDSGIRPWKSRALYWGHRCLLLGTALLVAYATIWAMYGFRFDPSPDHSFMFNWDFPETKDSSLGRTLRFARLHGLFPDAYLYGVGFTHEHSQVRHAFALGEYSHSGWWWYFPFAFFVKTPISTVLFCGWGLYSCVRRYMKGDAPDYYLVVPLIMYWVLSMRMNINIGSRHILPGYVLMLPLVGGLVMHSLRPRVDAAVRTLIGVGLSWTALITILSTPYFLAFFNLPSRLLWDRHYMLVDSSLDWGQDLGRLRMWMEENGVDHLKLSYRGNASPRHLNLQHEQLRGSNMYTDYESEWKWAQRLRPGDYVALSATNLVGVLFEDKQYYLAHFGKLDPVDIVGHSILIYRIPEKK